MKCIITIMYSIIMHMEQMQTNCKELSCTEGWGLENVCIIMTLLAAVITQNNQRKTEMLIILQQTTFRSTKIARPWLKFRFGEYLWWKAIRHVYPTSLLNPSSELRTAFAIFDSEVITSYSSNWIMPLLLCTSAPLVLCCGQFDRGSRQVKRDRVDLGPIS